MNKKFNVITGEKLQNIASIFLGLDEDFNWNPYIKNMNYKHLNINNISETYDNPKIIFCYSHRISILSEKIDFFKNNFILITHNSDENIIDNNISNKIIDSDKLIHWYAQNLCFEHYKISFLPIGMANRQWSHGNIDFFKDENNINNLDNKSEKIYMNFIINTNYVKRTECYNKLKDKINFLEFTDPFNNLKRLSNYKFCICPEGNGIDTHRFWEALYLKVVPIVLKNPLVDIINKNSLIPMVILNDWDSLDLSKLNYNDYKFNDDLYNKISFDYYKNLILYSHNIFDNNIFDIVIPIGPNDYDLIKTQIEYTKKNIIGYRNIYLIHNHDSLEIEGTINISENIFQFSIETVAKYHGKISRNGWYFQQLLKLYSGIVIPNILDKYLVIDADTFFLKPTFFYENGKCLYNYGNEYWSPYFTHMKKLDDIFTKQYRDKSGICHHMIFEKKYIKEIFDIVENKYNDSFYNLFLKNVNEIDFIGAGASEYEIYFNYIIYKHYDEIKIRKLNWVDSNTLILESDYDYISYHWHRR
jgi:hypothetical protein